MKLETRPTLIEGEKTNCAIGIIRRSDKGERNV